MNKTPITEDNEEPGVQVALSAAPRFGLKPRDAQSIFREIFSAVLAWRETGRQLRLKATTLDAYASAFDNPHMREAARLVG